MKNCKPKLNLEKETNAMLILVLEKVFYTKN